MKTKETTFSQQQVDSYQSPTIEVIKIELEGILCASGDIPTFGPENW